jgi:tRNA threonylcarbamoyladenosine modification (KEOPS) complex  Pcc1 subunit
VSRATVRTRHARPEVVARAVRPDNTAQIETRVEQSTDGERVVVTEIDRDDAAGLRATLDDYTVNLTVADEVVQLTDRHTTHP